MAKQFSNLGGFGGGGKFCSAAWTTTWCLEIWRKAALPLLIFAALLTGLDPSQECADHRAQKPLGQGRDETEGALILSREQAPTCVWAEVLACMPIDESERFLNAKQTSPNQAGGRAR